jgi:hypothetical protein
MTARENYTPDIVANFSTIFAADSTQIFSGLSYDRVRRQIIYCCNPVLANAVIGQPVTGSITNAGAFYTPGVYPAEPFTGGSGSGGAADITVGAGGNITICNIDPAGYNYLVGDVLSARPSGGLGSGFQFTLSAVSQGAQNLTGHALWSGQVLIPNNSFYDGTLYKNHSSMVKNISNDAVARYDAWSSTLTVPVGGGGGQPTAGTIVGGTGYNNGTWPGIPLSGGSGHGGNATFTVSGGAITAVAFTNGYGYAVSDVLTVDTTTYNGVLLGSGTGFSYTITAVTSGSDGTWRRVAESNATFISGYSTYSVIRIIDPRTGNIWAHHQMANGFVSQLYLLRKSANFQQEISPLVPPSPTMGIHPQIQGLTSNYLWYLQQQNNATVNGSFIVGTPRDITAAETSVDYLLPYPWFTWPYQDWTDVGAIRWASRCCADLSNNLYWLSFNYKSGGVGASRTYTILKLTEPSSSTPFNAATVGGSITDITPWSSTTGPNTGLPVNGTYNNWLQSNVVSKSALMYLPASNNLVVITKIFCQDLTAGATWNSTTQANTHFDCTYFDLTHNTFDYHANWLTGYMDNNLNPSVLASASWALIDFFEVDTDVNVHSYDFSSTGFDYTTRWFFLILSPVTGGTWTHPPGGENDSTNRTCLIQVKFVPGNAPAILQTIFDTGWNTAYAAFGTTIGNPNVITATAINSILSTNYYLLDSGVYDAASNSWWWSGTTHAMFFLNPAFTGRETLPLATIGASPPFLVMTLETSVSAVGVTGKTRVWGVLTN